MKIILKYFVVFIFLIMLFSFSSSLKLIGTNLSTYDSIEKHITGKSQKNIQLTIIINNSGNEGNNDTINYTEIIVLMEDSDDSDTINALNPSLQTGKSLFFKTQPLRIQHKSSLEEIDEIVEVSNHRYESSQCHKVIASSEEMQDSLYVAYEVGDDIWKEKLIYLPYHRIYFDDESEAVFRPYEFFNTDDSVVYISESFTVEGINKSIKVSKWCNSDGYPHILENANSDDHFDPVGCK